MLRRTVSKAFSAGPGQRLASVDPGAPQTRLQSVARLFAALHEEFAVHARKLEREAALGPGSLGPGSLGPGSLGPGSLGRKAGEGASVWLRLSKERTLLDGLEFVLETPQASFRFLNTLGGSIEVHRVNDGRLEPIEVLSVQRSGGEFAPIRKDLGVRGGFVFVTVPLLVERYAGRAGDSDVAAESGECPDS